MNGEERSGKETRIEMMRGFCIRKDYPYNHSFFFLCYTRVWGKAKGDVIIVPTRSTATDHLALAHLDQFPCQDNSLLSHAPPSHTNNAKQTQ
jgi:hypothetical protein